MKKNLLSVIILVLLVVNLALTSILMFSILPETKKTDKMITDICSILDLELNGDAEQTPIEDLVFYDFAEEMIVNFKPDTDGKAHYAVVSISIAMDSKHEDYKNYGETISEKESLMKNVIIGVIGQYTCEEGQADMEGMKAAILKELQDMFGSRFITQVIFSDIQFQ